MRHEVKESSRTKELRVLGRSFQKRSSSMVDRLVQKTMTEFLDFFVARGFRVTCPGTAYGHLRVGVTDGRVSVSLMTASDPAELWSGPPAIVLEKKEGGVRWQYQMIVVRHFPPARSRHESPAERLREATAVLPEATCSLRLRRAQTEPWESFSSFRDVLVKLFP